MKRTVIALSALLCFALSACGSGAATPAQERPEETAAAAVEVKAETDEEILGEAPEQTMAEFSRDEIHMLLPIFEDWEYELIESDGPGIRFWRTGDLKGYAELLYHDMFAICGTGVEEREADFLSGHPARVYYDGGPDWSFVVFDVDGAKGDYAAVNHGLTGGDARLALSMLGQAAVGE